MNPGSILRTRRNFVQVALHAVGGIAVLGSLGAGKKDPAVTLQHRHHRYIDVTHNNWGLTWRMQLPEVTSCRAGRIQNWQELDPGWTKTSSGGYRYLWESSEAYASYQIERYHPGADPKPKYLAGVVVDARIEPTRDGFETTIILTNKTDSTLEDLFCEGGCLQARENEAFAGDEGTESALRYAMVDGQFKRMDQLDRSQAMRCRYYSTDEAAERNSHFDFWGNSDTRIDEPAVIGAASKDGLKFLVFAYEKSNGIWQNSDEFHHCLHSSMELGFLKPGASVKRKGYVIFGSNLERCRKRLLTKLG